MNKKLRHRTTTENDGKKSTKTETNGTGSTVKTYIHDHRPTSSYQMNMTMIFNLLGPLIAVVVAIIWFYFHNNNTHERTKNLDKPDNNTETANIVPEWRIDIHPASVLHIGKDRCTIERIKESDMTYNKFITEYWRQKPIILVREPHINVNVQTYSMKQNMIQQFATESIPIAGVESYAFREEQTKSFIEYIDDLSTPSNGQKNSMAKHLNFNFGIDQYGIGDHYKVPNIINATTQGDINSVIENSWHFQVAIAGYGIGLPFHWHGDVFAEVLHGVRRWFVYPPNKSPQFNPRTTSQQWFTDIYLPMYAVKKLEGNHLLECTMYPNEALYVPADWFHATLSLGEAVSITTSFAQQYRNERFDIYDSGSADHAYMIDSMEKQNFTGAIFHAQQLVLKYRTDSFVPYSWLGVVYTLQTQNMQSEAEVISSLQLGKAATEHCIKLNPYYSPCYVWHSRQLIAYSYIVAASDPDLATEYKLKAKTAIKQASKLSFDNDDELLDPRWQPKRKNTMNVN